MTIDYNEDFKQGDLEYLKRFLGDECVEEYLRACNESIGREDVADEESPYNQVKIRLDYMKKMTEEGNRWWVNPDKKIIAYNQYYCQFLMVPFEDFMNGMGTLVGRPVSELELDFIPNPALEKAMKMSLDGETPPEELSKESFMFVLKNYKNKTSQS